VHQILPFSPDCCNKLDSLSLTISNQPNKPSSSGVFLSGFQP
jgi:hypothetical protein